MDPTTLTSLTQLGAAGLIGWMWLTERRAAADRDRQLAEAHSVITQERARLDVLMTALESNTRAITALELGQRHLAEAITKATPPPP